VDSADAQSILYATHRPIISPRVAESYQQATGIAPEIYSCSAADTAGEIA
jgi:hypothetical protein